VVGVGIFFLAIFWSCLTMPEGSIVRGEEVVPSANAVLATSAQQHGHHSASVRERAAQGQVRVISYNFFLRPDLLTDASTAGENDFKDERLELLVEKLDNYDVVLLQETWITNSAGRKERLVAAARKRGFGFWVRSACRGDLIDAMLVHKFSKVSI